MDSFLRFVIRWGAIILAFDAVASLTADASGTPRGWFSVGSAILFFLVGVRGRIRLGPKLALRAAILVATIDATLGWAILWSAGPGRPVGTAPLSAIVVGGVSAVLVGSVIALLGVVAGRAFVRRESPG
jgi:hypothetical protein